jgi:HK97 family phage prohead protease
MDFLKKQGQITSTTDEGIVEAFVSTYDVVDSQNDVVKFGSYKDSLNEKLPTVCNSHNWEDVIGKVVFAEEVPAGDPRLPEAIKQNGGLFVRMQFNLEVEKAKETFSNIKFGAITEFSVGIKIDESDWVDKSGVLVREISKCTLAEVSPVIRGASPNTTVVATKQETYENQLDFAEKTLKDLQAWTLAMSEMRLKAGRKISEARLSRLKESVTTFKSIIKELEAIISEATIDKSKSDRMKTALLIKLKSIQ